ncbi:MAG: hypothetical protein ACPGSM_21650 [Thiolinea sp.]
MLNPIKLLQAGACVFLVAFALPFSSIAAGENFRVNLIATIDDGPAMESVEWTVLRNGTETVETARKHSTHVNIPPGKYKVVARLTSDDKTVVRTRNFLVRNNTQVVVPMDD